VLFRFWPPLMLAALKTPEYRQNVRNDRHFAECPVYIAGTRVP
jgi:hypothetical protein